MTERWLRWYDGTVRDGKLRIAAELAGVSVSTIIGAWASLLEDAATSTPRGTATRGIGYHAMYLQIAENELAKIWNALERVGTVGTVKEREGEICIINWHKRQFETDHKDPTARDRKEKWKQRHKSSGTARNDLERFGTPETETKTDIRKRDFHPIKARENGRKGPRHGATGKGYTYIHQGTTEWEIYAADWRKIKFCDPEPDQNGGKWFKTAGEVVPC